MHHVFLRILKGSFLNERSKLHCAEKVLLSKSALSMIACFVVETTPFLSSSS